jgi:hypothetical protein
MILISIYCVWSLTTTDGKRLRVLENRVLRRISLPEKKEIGGGLIYKMSNLINCISLQVF